MKAWSFVLAIRHLQHGAYSSNHYANICRAGFEYFGELALARYATVRAIKLYGAAASYRVTPAERIQQEKTFAIVRDRIGAAAFAAAWAAGCALALDQAIAEALHPYQRES